MKTVITKPEITVTLELSEREAGLLLAMVQSQLSALPKLGRNHATVVFLTALFAQLEAPLKKYDVHVPEWETTDGGQQKSK